MDLVRGSIVLIVLAMIGCGDGGPAPVAVEPPAQTAGIDAVKSMLQDVAGSGELGSGAPIYPPPCRPPPPPTPAGVRTPPGPPAGRGSPPGDLAPAA